MNFFVLVFFDQIAYSKGFIDKKRLRLFTKDVLQVKNLVKKCR